MITLYYSPNCSKCRLSKKILTCHNLEFIIRDYLKKPLNNDELLRLLDKLKRPETLIRSDVTEGRLLSNNNIAKLIIEDPSLMQRPTLETESNAIIARPPFLIYNFLNI